MRMTLKIAVMLACITGLADSSFALRPKSFFDRGPFKSGYTNNESLYHRGIRGAQVVICPKSNVPSKRLDLTADINLISYAKEAELYSVTVYPGRNIVCFSHIFYSGVSSLLDENYPGLSKEPPVQFYFVYDVGIHTYTAQLRGDVSADDPEQLRSLLESLRMLTDLGVDFQLRRFTFVGDLPINEEGKFVTREVLEARLSRLQPSAAGPASAGEKPARRARAASKKISAQI